MAKPIRNLLAALVLAALLPTISYAVQLPAPGEPVDVEKILASMTIEEKVGQLLMIGFGGTKINRQITHWLVKRHAGSVALFSRNIVNFEQTARFTRELHELTKDNIPIFLSLDQEGGNVVRVKDGAMVLPGNMALGATRSSVLAYVAGQALGVDLRLLGFNMNLAPVLDVNSNPSNPVIGIRSYGERPELVGKLGAWFVRGQQEQGIVAVAKHFPGHGDTTTDSHFSMPSVKASMQRLQQIELHPFRRAMNAGLDAVMTAHIALPRIAETADTPATLSHVVLTDILRKRLDFDGLILTDGLEMQGIIARYGAGRAAVMAIKAGADMTMVLWMPDMKEEVYQTLLAAARSSEISKQRLDESVRRILMVKAKRHLFDRKLEPLNDLLSQRNENPIHTRVAERIARESVTLVRNNGNLLPLQPIPYRRVLVVAPPGPFLQRMAKQRNIVTFKVPYVPNRERRLADINRATDLAYNADLVIVAAINRYQVELAKAVLRKMKNMPMVLVSFASPYYLASIPQIDAYVCTYSYLNDSQEAAAKALLGLAPMTGRLPVTIPGYYAYGHRVGEEHASITSTASIAIQ
ncbi:MAG: beta-N-acetylhexosaminidase [Deltaproteobacteria bacterium]|nr:beta-N-acetylhexosaminidase [Deltaproteobacteria bacterium]